MQPEFYKFQDKLKTFTFSRGKMTGDIDHDAKNYTGKFKVQLFNNIIILTFIYKFEKILSIVRCFAILSA